MANPGWLRLDGHRIALLGAAAQMSPLQPLARWGADVALVDVPRPQLWDRVWATVRVAPVGQYCPRRKQAGLDVVADTPELRSWLAQLPGPLTIASYTYLDGAQHVLVNAAIDAVVGDLQHRGDVSLGFLATPTDIFSVPMAAVEESRRRWSPTAMQRATSFVSRQRLMTPNYPDTLHRGDGREVGINDCLVLQQGPNYALAKHLQRWRPSPHGPAHTHVDAGRADDADPLRHEHRRWRLRRGRPRFGPRGVRSRDGEHADGDAARHDLCIRSRRRIPRSPRPPR